jgi:2,4-dienoyl-CoA reductase (NADPH2)
LWQGPVGMETARVLALREHSVVLCEAADRLGGQINILARAPGREPWLDAAAWLVRQLEQLPVDIRLGTCVDANLIKMLKPDCVIVAIGARPRRPKLAAADNRAIPIQSMSSRAHRCRETAS